MKYKRLEHLLIEEYRRPGTKRVRGFTVTFPDGQQCYMARRKHKDIYSGFERNLSKALRNRTGGWTIELDILLKMKANNIGFAGVYVTDTQDVYMTHLERFFQTGLASLVQITKSGQVHKMLPVHAFRLRRSSFAL